MRSPRRVTVFIAGAVGTVALVAVGPGGIALGAARGSQGANSPRSAPGQNGTPDISGRGRNGHTGQQGPNGPAGASIQGRNGKARANIDPDVDLNLPPKNLSERLKRKAAAQVRRALLRAGV